MLQIAKRAGNSPQQHCKVWAIPTCEESSTHSQLCQVLVSGRKTFGLDIFKICPNWNMGRSRTTATLQITKRTGAAPQQHCELRNEQELHHSNIVKCKTSASRTTATQLITKRTTAAPRQDCELQHEQEHAHRNSKHICGKCGFQ